MTPAWAPGCGVDGPPLAWSRHAPLGTAQSPDCFWCPAGKVKDMYQGNARLLQLVFHQLHPGLLLAEHVLDHSQGMPQTPDCLKQRLAPCRQGERLVPGSGQNAAAAAARTSGCAAAGRVQ